MKLKELYSTAKKELSDLFPLDNSDFRLEQAEFNKKDNVWEVVVSYLVENTNKPIKSISPLAAEYKFHRIYKMVKINNSGEVVGFFIYNKE